jgi:hypothetical protein
MTDTMTSKIIDWNLKSNKLYGNPVKRLWICIKLSLFLGREYNGMYITYVNFDITYIFYYYLVCEAIGTAATPDLTLRTYSELTLVRLSLKSC